MRIRFILTLIALVLLGLGGFWLLREYTARNELSTAYAAGVAYQDAQDWEHASDAYRRVIALDPNYGDVQIRLQQVAQALDAQQVTQLYPRGATLLAQQKWQAAADVLAQVVALDPHYRDASSLLAQARAKQAELDSHYSRGMAAYSAKKWSEALAEFQAALLLLGGEEKPGQRLEVEQHITLAEQELVKEQEYTSAINHMVANQVREARADFWKIIAIDPTYRDVDARMVETADDAWPAFGLNAAHVASINLGDPLSANPQTIWEYQTPSFIAASPVLNQGLLYAPSGNGTLYVLSAATGHERWSKNLDAPINAAPLINNQMIYIGTESGAVYAIDTAGKQIWQAQTKGNITAGPALAGNRLYVASNDGKLYAFDATNGGQIWASQMPGALYSSPAVSGNTVVVGCGDGNVYAFSAANGSMLWSTQTGAAVHSSAAISGGVAYIGSQNGNVYAYDVRNGMPRWNAVSGGSVDSSPLIAGNLLVFGSGDGKVYGLDAREGKLIWTFNAGEPILSSPVMVDRLIYIGSENGHLYGLDPRSGEMRWSAETKGAISSQPVAGDGILIVASYDGKLHGYH